MGMVNISGYLVVKMIKGRKYSWPKYKTRFITKKPASNSNEIAIAIEAQIPAELFERPQLKFKINVPKEAVPKKEISAEVIGNIKDLIELNLGMEINLIAPERNEG